MQTPGHVVLPSRYCGILFRSRLEARWAVFLDYLQIPFHYEIEGFRLRSGNYLPDFFLPNLQCFVEIKPSRPSNQETNLALDLARASNKIVYIFWGPIECPSSSRNKGINSAWAFSPSGEITTNHYWSECPKCGAISIQQNGYIKQSACQCPPPLSHYTAERRRILDAYNAAAAYRFDGQRSQINLYPVRVLDCIISLFRSSIGYR